jgi:hypothetical protein
LHEIDHLRLVKIIANVTSQVFSSTRFGFFEQVKKIKFGSGFRGLFREAHGKIPFTRVWEYKGPDVSNFIGNPTNYKASGLSAAVPSQTIHS